MSGFKRYMKKLNNGERPLLESIKDSNKKLLYVPFKKREEHKKIKLWSLYSKNTKQSKTLDINEALFIGINLKGRKTKPRRKITKEDGNYSFTYDKERYYFNPQNLSEGATTNKEL